MPPQKKFCLQRLNLLIILTDNWVNKHVHYEPLHNHQSATVAILLKKCHAKGSYRINTAVYAWFKFKN